MNTDFSKYYTTFLKGHEGKIHFCGHSHHFWPDVTKDAAINYWEDSAKLSDDKWNFIFSQKIPRAQQLLAKTLGLKAFEQIVFAPNTHELVYRLLSCFDPKKKVKVLTTDSEFHSFSRQIKRLQEDGLVDCETIPLLPFDTFVTRFASKMESSHPDFVYLSHVFFNSGLALKTSEIEKLSSLVDEDMFFVLDGYHSFMALPFSLKNVQEKIFFVAGSYKYAGAGEGCSFMSIPSKFHLRPRQTGWFAHLPSLEQMTSEQEDKGVKYSADGYSLAGSTMDFSTLYKLIAVLELWESEGIKVDDIHAKVFELQNQFLTQMDQLNHFWINRQNLIAGDLNHHGHFLAFNLQEEKKAKELKDQLHKKNVLIDTRGPIARFGFAPYLSSDFDLSLILSGIE